MTFNIQIDDVEKNASATETARIQELQNAEVARKQVELNKASAKEAAQAKLGMFGLTTDDLKALGL